MRALNRKLRPGFRLWIVAVFGSGIMVKKAESKNNLLCEREIAMAHTHTHTIKTTNITPPSLYQYFVGNI